MEGIDKRAPDFEASAKESELIASILGGTRIIRAGGRTYLPQFEGETDKSYQTRLGSAVLANFFADAIRNISSRPFGRDVVVHGADGLPVDDVTRSGISLQEYSQTFFASSVAYGEAFTICEFPQTDGNVTLADMRARNIRPYLVPVSQNAILDYVEDAGICTHFRYLTARTVRSGFHTQKIQRIVSYDPGKINVYEKNDGGNWALYQSVVTGFDAVPVTRLVTGSQALDMRPIPPLIDAAYKQVEHYQVSAGLRYNLDMTAYPMLAFEGSQESDESIPTGPGTVLFAPEGSIKLLEPSGTSYSSIQSRVDAIERELLLLCLQPIIPQAGNIAALVGEIQAAKAHSAIKAWAKNLEESMERMLGNMALWMDKKEPNIEVSIDTDFGLNSATMNEVGALINAYKSQAIDDQTLIAELVKRNFISPKADS